MKLLKSFLLSAALCAASFTANAQFRGPGPGAVDILKGVPLTVTAGAVSNITVFGVPTQNGYSISPYFVLTNSGTPAVAFQATPVVPTSSGAGATVGSAVQIGTVAGNGTTPVRGNILVLTNQNCVGIQIGVSNAHTASIVVSNLYFISQ